jgi:hypothetical protein
MPGSHVAKYPILLSGDEVGSAERTTEQQDWMTKALCRRLRGGGRQERQEPRGDAL